MSFKLNPNKQAIEECFSNKRDKGNYPPLHFNSTNVQVVDSQKHLCLVLGSKLNFNEHIESKISKCNKIISLVKKLSQILTRKSLLTIYKSFVIPKKCASLINMIKEITLPCILTVQTFR